MSIKASDRNQENVTQPSQERRSETHVTAQQQQRALRFSLLMQKKAQPQKLVVATMKQPLKKPTKSPSSSESIKPDTAEKFEHATSRTVDPTNNNFASSVGNQQYRELSVDKDPTIIAHTAIASGRADDINQLIKKLTLSFSAKHQDARFSIATGVFAGAHFSLHNDDRDLNLEVSNASADARRLLVDNQSILKEYLAAREINLCDLTFSS